MNPPPIAPAAIPITSRSDHGHHDEDSSLIPGDGLFESDSPYGFDATNHARDSFDALLAHNNNNYMIPQPPPQLQAHVSAPPPPPPHYMYHPRDHSILLDHNGDPLSIDRMLGSHPLQSELATRPGPGNKRLLYLRGDAITRLLNQVFGYNGWNLTILKSDRLVPPGGEVVATSSNGAGGQQQSQQHKHHVAYMSHVRITLLTAHHPQPHHASSSSSSSSSLVFREDVGFGDATDRNFYTAAQHALKSSITDGLKRAARHFGDRLGNSLYDSQHFSFASAPKTQQESLNDWDKRWNQKYGDMNANGNASRRDDGKAVDHGGQRATANKENMSSTAANRVQPSTTSYHKMTMPPIPQPPHANTAAAKPTTTFMGAPTTRRASVGPMATNMNQPPSAVSRPHQQQQQSFNPPTSHATAAPLTASTNTSATNPQPPQLAAAPAPPFAHVQQQPQQPSPTATYWVRNPATMTNTNAAQAAASSGNMTTSTAGAQRGAMSSTGPSAPSTTTTPFVQNQQPLTATTTTTTATFDFYDIAQRPLTAHGTHATAPPTLHHVTPASTVVMNHNKRPATTETWNDPKKTKSTTSAATMNPYGSRG